LASKSNEVFASERDALQRHRPTVALASTKSISHIGTDDTPYISSPPDIIPIDIGRQLFVDDFLIENTTLRRTYHVAEYYPDNPVLKPDQPWESEGGLTAMVFSDGVWYDPNDHLYKMWYMGGYGRYTCYASSRDGIYWEKPVLDVLRGTNVVHAGDRDSCTVWLDLEEEDPQRIVWGSDDGLPESLPQGVGI
jgi:hypothetical protein